MHVVGDHQVHGIGGRGCTHGRVWACGVGRWRVGTCGVVDLCIYIYPSPSTHVPPKGMRAASVQHNYAKYYFDRIQFSARKAWN